MSTRWRVASAVVATAVTVMVLVATGTAGVLLVTTLKAPLSSAILPGVAAFVASGWYLVLRRPTHPVAWLLLAAGTSMCGVFCASTYASWGLQGHAGAPLVTPAVWVSGWAFAPMVGSLLLLALLFPSGRLPGRHWYWRVVLVADLVYLAAAAANMVGTDPISIPEVGNVANPYAVPQVMPVLRVVVGGVAGPGFFLGVTGAVATVVARLRTSTGVERQQMKWAAYAFALAPLPFVVYNFYEPATGPMAAVLLPLVPAALTLSVLRYRLYDIDRVVSRTVAYAVVTGVLVAVYVGCVALTTRLLPLSSSFGVAASTLVAAAAFQPLRHRVQARVDRRFNRARYDAARTVDEFSARLRDEVDLPSVTADLVATISRTVQPASVSLWTVSV